MVFQSTPPARGATKTHAAGPVLQLYFNPRPPRGGRLVAMAWTVRRKAISIHAPREGGDSSRLCQFYVDTAFQSTPPARGATRQPGEPVQHRPNFNPRPPRGGRPKLMPLDLSSSFISIHAPREGGDLWRWHGPCAGRQFQSTPPARGATPAVCANSTWTPHFNPRPPRGGRPASPENLYNIAPISIHAPREGGDSKDAQFYLWIFDK